MSIHRSRMRRTATQREATPKVAGQMLWTALENRRPPSRVHAAEKETVDDTPLIRAMDPNPVQGPGIKVVRKPGSTQWEVTTARSDSSGLARTAGRDGRGGWLAETVQKNGAQEQHGRSHQSKPLLVVFPGCSERRLHPALGEPLSSEFAAALLGLGAGALYNNPRNSSPGLDR
jgi:hypothetical protein